MSTACRLRPLVQLAAATLVTIPALPSPAEAAPPPGVAEPRLMWERSYDGGTGHHDYATSVAATHDAIYIAGSTEDPDAPADFTVLRYSLHGNLKWERHYGGTADRAGRPSDLAVGPDGGV